MSILKISFILVFDFIIFLELRINNTAFKHNLATKALRKAIANPLLILIRHES